MRLLQAPTSPFARKVRVTAHELGLDLALVPTNPWTSAELRALNPLSKVPTLLREDGPPLFESAVICEFLNHRAGGTLLPPPGEARWAVLLVQAVADGIGTAAGRLFADEQRPPDQRAEAVMQRQAMAIAAGLDRLESEPLSPFLADLGAIAAACALGYLDFRWPGRDWRGAHPALAHWFKAVAARPSMTATQHRLA